MDYYVVNKWWAIRKFGSYSAFKGRIPVAASIRFLRQLLAVDSFRKRIFAGASGCSLICFAKEYQCAERKGYKMITNRCLFVN